MTQKNIELAPEPCSSLAASIRTSSTEWQTETPGVTPPLDLYLTAAVALTENLGDTLRLDYINAIGPTDAWVTLDTVTLTNTSQLYFDTSCIGQPRRLYRIVPGP